MKKNFKVGIIASIVLLTVVLFGWSEIRMSSISMIASDNIEALTDPSYGNDPYVIDPTTGDSMGIITPDGRLLLFNQVNRYHKNKIQAGCDQLNKATCDTFAWLQNDSEASCSDWKSWVKDFCIQVIITAFSSLLK